MKQYKDGEVDFEDLEKAVMDLSKQGLGAALAKDSYSMAYWVAQNIEGERDAYYNCKYYDNFGEPHYPVLEELLKEWFNSLTYKHKTYWFDKNVSKNTILKWLHDDFRGTMENPYF